MFGRFSLVNYAMQQFQNLFTESLEGKVESVVQFLMLKGTLTDKLKKWCFKKYCSCDKACQFSAF